jgi:hypothetical protein
VLGNSFPETGKGRVDEKRLTVASDEKPSLSSGATCEYVTKRRRVSENSASQGHLRYQNVYGAIFLNQMTSILWDVEA